MEDRLTFIKDFADYMLQNIKYNSAFSVENIENCIVLYGLYKASIYLDSQPQTEEIIKESACIDCLYNKLRNTLNLPEESNEKYACLLLENSTGNSCGCFKKE